MFFCKGCGHPSYLHSFPTRRSSDLGVDEIGMLYRGEDSQITSYLEHAVGGELAGNLADVCPVGALLQKPQILDRKSTRLNSSHQIISYAVFCLKKKKNTTATSQSHT